MPIIEVEYQGPHTDTHMHVTMVMMGEEDYEPTFRLSRYPREFTEQEAWHKLEKEILEEYGSYMRLIAVILDPHHQHHKVMIQQEKGTFLTFEPEHMP